jgi:hypothetical protein
MHFEVSPQAQYLIVTALNTRAIKLIGLLILKPDSNI